MPLNVQFDAMTLLDWDSFVFDGWYVRLGFPRDDGGVQFVDVRKQLVRSRTVAEEADRLERALRDTPNVPGRHRLEERVKELRSRAGRFNTGTKESKVTS